MVVGLRCGGVRLWGGLWWLWLGRDVLDCLYDMLGIPPDPGVGKIAEGIGRHTVAKKSFLRKHHEMAQVSRFAA